MIQKTSTYVFKFWTQLTPSVEKIVTLHGFSTFIKQKI